MNKQPGLMTGYEKALEDVEAVVLLEAQQINNSTDIGKCYITGNDTYLRGKFFAYKELLAIITKLCGV